MNTPIAGFPGSYGSVRLHRFLMPVLATIKHPSFADEIEWRLVLANAFALAEVRTSFRVGDFGFAPYIEVPLPAESVAEVVVGPSPHPEIRKAGVQRLLSRLGLPSVAVTGSDTPLRS